MRGWPETFARRARRGVWAVALLACLPVASLWRRFVFRPAKLGPSRSSDEARGAPGLNARAVGDLVVAARWLGTRMHPAPNCLTMALAGRWLLRAAGAPGEIRIGVRIDAEGGFHSHAWLVSQERAVTGGSALNQGFTEIWPPRRVEGL